jgi:hypothetical protein
VVIFDDTSLSVGNLKGSYHDYCRNCPSDGGKSEWIGVIAFVIALVVSPAIRVADQWERVAILRLGKCRKQE